MRRELGLWGLTALGIAGVVGSGWLFAAMTAAKIAGPASILAWAIGGALMIPTSLCFAEIGSSFPIEASVILDYAGHYFPSLVGDGGAVLSWAGRIAAVALTCMLTLLNFMAVKWFARLNNIISWWKLLLPFAGFRIISDMAEEARRPGRDLPLAFAFPIIFATAMYIAIQVAFLGSVDPQAIAGGWDKLEFVGSSAPLMALLYGAGAVWLAKLVFFDAAISPARSALRGRYHGTIPPRSQQLT